jgi:hypothetical protein
MAEHLSRAQFRDSDTERSTAHLGEALEFVRVAIANCERAGLSGEIISAALAIELVPRLVAAFGVNQARLVLRQIMDAAEEDHAGIPHPPIV